MNNTNICKIVQDLLPNYIEQLTTSETNLFIEDHLKDCPECKSLYNTMIDGETIHKTHNQVSIKFMKKYRNILYSTLVSCIIFIAISTIPMTIATIFYKNSYEHLEQVATTDKENLAKAGFKVVFDEKEQNYFVEDLISGVKFRETNTGKISFITKEGNYEK